MLTIFLRTVAIYLILTVTMRLTANATRRDVAPLAMLFTRSQRSSGMNSRAISGMIVMHDVQSTIRISVSSEPDSK